MLSRVSSPSLRPDRECHHAEKKYRMQCRTHGLHVPRCGCTLSGTTNCPQVKLPKTQSKPILNVELVHGAVCQKMEGRSVHKFCRQRYPRHFHGARSQRHAFKTARKCTWVLLPLIISHPESDPQNVVSCTTSALTTKLRNQSHSSLLATRGISRIQPPGANRFHQGCMIALGLIGIGDRKFCKR